MKAMYPFAACAVLLVGSLCPEVSGQERGVIDGSTAARFTLTLQLVAETVRGEQRTEFDGVVELASEFSGDAASLRERLNGMDAAAVLKLGKELRRSLDSNNDGTVDVVEKARGLAKITSERIVNNERSAIETMQAILKAQLQVRELGAIDTDDDGIGEFGYLACLAGHASVAGVGSGRLNPPLLPSDYVVRRSQLIRSGYVFQLWLPGIDGKGVAEAEDGGVNPRRRPNADRAEKGFVCYAWPTAHAKSGRRVFMTNASGDIFCSLNESMKYSGCCEQPDPMAAYPLGAKEIFDSLISNDTRQDAQEWLLEIASASLDR